MTHPNVLLTLEESRLRYVSVECAVCRASAAHPRVMSSPGLVRERVRQFAEKHDRCQPLPRLPSHVDVDAFLESVE